MKIKNFLFKLFIILVVLFLAIIVLFISINSEKVPELYAFTDSRTAKASMGNYVWYAFSEVLQENGKDKTNYVFKSENTLLLYPGEKFSISNNINAASRRNFSIDKIYYDNSYNSLVQVDYQQPSNSFSEMNIAEIVAPETEDTYYYYFSLNYHEKGKVEYALKVIVSSEPKYELEQLLRYKNTSLMDIESINSIIGILAYSRNKTNIVVDFNNIPRKLIIQYSEILMDRDSFLNNVLSLFILIPELDVVEYKSNNVRYIYTRREFELKYERELSDYINDKDLWEAEVFFGEKQIDQSNTLHKLFSSIIIDAIGLESGDTKNEIVVNTQSFVDNTLYDVSDITKQLLLIELCNKIENVFNVDYETYEKSINRNIFVEAVNIKEFITSGDTIILSGDSIETSSGDNPLTLHNNEIYLSIIKGSKKETYKYTCNYVDNSWFYDKEIVDN